jgi:S1-C subfamily serine protease
VKKLILSILVVFILFVAAGNVVKNYEDNQFVEVSNYAVKANVIIEGKGFDTGYFGRSYWVGSGVVIDSNGLIVTAGHCVENAEIIRVTLSDGSVYTIDNYYQDPCDDIGILRVPTKTFNYVELGSILDIYDGLKVFDVGNAWGIYDNKVTKGFVVKSRFRRCILSWDSEFIYANIDIAPGCSGGGVYSFDNFKLIGIAVMSKNDSDDSFIVPVDEILEAISNCKL